MDADTDTLRRICAGVGFDVERAEGSLLERVALLAERSESVADSVRMVRYAEAVFRLYDAEAPSKSFSPLERRTVVLACLFSDVGKTGPDEADPDGRRLVAEMFAVEGVRDDRITVSEFLRAYFPGDADERVARFERLGLDPAMSIRQFWNLHSGWTLAISERAGLPREAVAAAATHHLLEGVNPDAIVGEDGRFTRDFGDNVAFDRAEKLVIVLDKYDAVRRRSGRDHAATIAWLRERLATNPRFRGDAELAALIDDVDRALGPTGLDAG